VSTPLSLSDLDRLRRNGELVFDAPWQSTVFAVAAAVVEHAFGGDREPFRQQLIKPSRPTPAAPYWELDRRARGTGPDPAGTPTP
jgi:hypothetical protein